LSNTCRYLTHGLLFALIHSFLVGSAWGRTGPEPSIAESGDVAATSESFRLIRVVDGDTLVAEGTNGEIKVRLMGIDAPESDQPFGPEAADLITTLIGNQTLHIRGKDLDRYGRILAHVDAGEMWLNLEMVRRGGAWVYQGKKDRYAVDLEAAQSLAKSARSGLWSAANPIYPGDWRKSLALDHAPLPEANHPTPPSKIPPMDLAKTFEFIWKLSFGRFDLIGWLLATLLFAVSMAVIGYLWGLLWNRKWSIGKHTLAAIGSLVIAIAVSLLALQWRTINEALAWIAEQRAGISQQLANAGSENRQILRKAWDKLQPFGGQEGLTPLADGGNELRLNNESEARILMMTAADSAASQLRNSAAFRYGLPVETKDPTAIATEVALAEAQFPVIVNPSNSWTRDGLVAQAYYAFDSATRKLTDPLQELKTYIGGGIVVLLLIQAGIVAAIAFNDIKANPKVHS
jgi:micrococcal nuclease